jgi:hypothetical protein
MIGPAKVCTDMVRLPDGLPDPEVTLPLELPPELLQAAAVPRRVITAPARAALRHQVGLPLSLCPDADSVELALDLIIFLFRYWPHLCQARRRIDSD